MTNRVTAAVTATAVAALLVAALIFLLFPLAISQSWLIALAILLAVALAGTAFSLRITQGGTTTSINFLPELGAVPLLGPTGAVVLAAVSAIVSEAALRRKPVQKIIFNSAQSVLSVGLAAVIYSIFGPPVSLNSLDFWSGLPAFVGAGIVYFTVNSTAVVHVIAADTGQSFASIWQQVAGKTFLIDVALSPIAFTVPLLYLQWGPLALLLTLVPIIGLRYSYGLNIELRNLNRDLLRVLVKTLEAQDPYTSGHSVRVSENARAIAAELGLGFQKIRQIETAALLHDIGKIGQAYHEILRQETPLSEEQVETIRNHPNRGAEIIQPVRSLDPSIVDFIRHHHERFDGTGYPDGLKGEQIPLGARVIMVADTIDAMATDRPYRSACSLNEIYDELLKHSGAQFDPDVVDAAIAADVLVSADETNPD